MLVDLLSKLTVRSHRGTVSLVMAFAWGDMDRWFKGTEKHRRHHTPLSEHLFDLLREPLRRYLPDDHQFDETFDRFEYMRSLVHADMYNKRERKITDWYGPMGRFCWKRHGEVEPLIINRVEEEAAEAGSDWPLIRHGLFDGSYERFREVKAEFDAVVAKCSWR